MVGDELEHAGWNVAFLGTGAPHSGVDAVLAQDSCLLFISATMLFNVPNVVRLMRDLRARSPKLRALKARNSKCKIARDENLRALPSVEPG
jgi:methanogenic corrinoid protein MtbC1